jgi:2-keto-4-pentenoate hydratase/2-oxohepta-3-ene-1,7-dioic acid hydratase in catechol pathway
VPKNSKKTDWEVELGLVIGKKAQYIDKKDALKFIFGFFLVNDLTERSWQKERSGQWVKGKSADTFGPIGPFLITKDDLIDYQNLDMFLDVDNKRMQIGNTNKMIYKVNFLVSYLSQFMTLNPGDIITTGTPPGVGENKRPPIFLRGGETIQLGITNLGIQKHKVISYK